MVKSEYDATLGIVRLEGQGFFSLGDEERAATLTRDAVKACHAANGDMKMLVICSTQVQSPEVMEAAALRCRNMNGVYDRVAFVFTSSLAKMQAARFFNSHNRQCFISENAAITWLLADRGMARIEVA